MCVIFKQQWNVVSMWLIWITELRVAPQCIALVMHGPLEYCTNIAYQYMMSSYACKGCVNFFVQGMACHVAFSTFHGVGASFGIGFSNHH